MNPAFKTVVFWAVIVISAMLLFQVVKAKPTEATSEISYSQFMAAVQSGDVAKVTIAGNRIQGQYRNNGAFWLFGPANQSLFLDSLREKGVQVWFKGRRQKACHYNCWELGLLCYCSALFGPS